MSALEPVTARLIRNSSQANLFLIGKKKKKKKKNQNNEKQNKKFIVSTPGFT